MCPSRLFCCDHIRGGIDTGDSQREESQTGLRPFAVGPTPYAVSGARLVRGSSERAVFKTHGVEFDAPVGSALIAVALFVIAYSYTMYARVTAEKKDIEDKLAKTQTDLAS